MHNKQGKVSKLKSTDILYNSYYESSHSKKNYKLIVESPVLGKKGENRWLR